MQNRSCEFGDRKHLDQLWFHSWLSFFNRWHSNVFSMKVRSCLENQAELWHETNSAAEQIFTWNRWQFWPNVKEGSNFGTSCARMFFRALITSKNRCEMFPSLTFPSPTRNVQRTLFWFFVQGKKGMHTSRTIFSQNRPKLKRKFNRSVNIHFFRKLYFSF